MKEFILNNNLILPSIGYGMGHVDGYEVVYKAIEEAYRDGYRLIDTASYYKNEKELGKAIKDLNINREELFITSKVWRDSMGYDNTIKSFNKSLEDLDTDYIDLYLIHWPAFEEYYGDNTKEINLETWKALIDLYKSGKVKAIGVSNFSTEDLKPLLDTEIKPMINQIKYHIGNIDDELVNFCNLNNIVVQAYSPLGRGAAFEGEGIKLLCNKYNKTLAQVAVRYCIDKGVLPLPKSVNPSRIKENIDVYNFFLTKEDIELLEK